MKVLLSAYACEPNRGSEPGVGWHWAIELARFGHEVWALTRANNLPVIEGAFLHESQPANLHFLYYDLPDWAKWWKKGGHGAHLYYLLWQWGAYLLARKKHREFQFDLVHHVTFVSARQPSFMGNLGIPCIFGPVAGGERAPWRLRFGYGLKGWTMDVLRDMANLLVKIDPMMHRTFRQADKIYVTSEQTRALIPGKYRHKVKTQLAIGVETLLYKTEKPPMSAMVNGKNKKRILYVGHFLYLKGMHLGLSAFARLVATGVDSRLTMVGKGPDENRWRKLIEKMGITNYIDWIPWVSQGKLAELYTLHDIFLFPSLHDSGGIVVLEAMANGLPVVCLDLGGPGQIVDSSCGRVISTVCKSQQEVILRLSEALCELAGSLDLRNQLSEGALQRVKEFHWSLVVSKIYEQLSNRENTPSP